MDCLENLHSGLAEYGVVDFFTTQNQKSANIVENPKIKSKELLQPSRNWEEI